jgi:uncharacterized phage protein (TIGR02216 family)
VTALPFPDWVRLAMRMGMSPSEFWALSLKEWRVLTTGDFIQPLHRAALDTLRARYPD